MSFDNANPPDTGSRRRKLAAAYGKPHIYKHASYWRVSPMPHGAPAHSQIVNRWSRAHVYAQAKNVEKIK